MLSLEIGPLNYQTHINAIKCSLQRILLQPRDTSSFLVVGKVSIGFRNLIYFISYFICVQYSLDNPVVS